MRVGQILCTRLIPAIVLYKTYIALKSHAVPRYLQNLVDFCAPENPLDSYKLKNPYPSKPLNDCKGSLRDNSKLKEKAYIPFQFNCPVLQLQQLHGSFLVSHFQFLIHLVVGNAFLCRIPQRLLSILPILLSLLKCIKVLLYLQSQQATTLNTDLAVGFYINNDEIHSSSLGTVGTSRDSRTITLTSQTRKVRHRQVEESMSPPPVRCPLTKAHCHLTSKLFSGEMFPRPMLSLNKAEKYHCGNEKKNPMGKQTLQIMVMYKNLLPCPQPNNFVEIGAII